MNFFVPGIPRPQGSKKGFINKKTGGVILTESGGQAHKDWRAVVTLAAREAWGDRPKIEGPVEAYLTFYLPRPKSHPKTRVTYPTSRPDIDKLARAALDALTHICFSDDAQIITLGLAKNWADPDVGLRVSIWEWSGAGA